MRGSIRAVTRASIPVVSENSLYVAYATGELVPTEAELARAENREYEPADARLVRIAGNRKRSPHRKSAKNRKREEEAEA